MEKIAQSKQELTLYNTKHQYSVRDSRDLLEYLVNQKLTEWQVYNIDPASDNYISESNMNECIVYIIKKIILEMTPVMKDKLSVGYPMETEEQQIESIKNVAKLAVLNYSIQQNQPKEHNEVIKNINAF